MFDLYDFLLQKRKKIIKHSIEKNQNSKLTENHPNAVNK